MKHFLEKYRHAWVFLYFLIYIPWFQWLERNISAPKYIIETTLDDEIPFCEYFIIPYMLWFVFIAIGVCYFFFQNKQEFYRLITLLFLGMTIFLIISTLFPNGQQLRPTTFKNNNIFVELVKQLYIVDTPTNILPSIHVYNTLCVYFSFRTSYHMQHTFSKKHYKWILNGTGTLSALIILSTVFLKQHSILDVISAFLLFFILFPLVYRIPTVKYSCKEKPVNF